MKLFKLVYANLACQLSRSIAYLRVAMFLVLPWTKVITIFA